MKNFKKFAMMLVAVVLVLLIGVFFKGAWKGIVANFVIWICALFGLQKPGWCNNFVKGEGAEMGTENESDYVSY